ncbi:type II toxin-antitoxin system PemK/MazF family toxin [Georgenia sp. Z1344]|uniref:type II toxin-antitoxin system PemK/MazF family toxin n=1 Tax=Georgenia sp. Z1344 TaxID=3416706 RepID=UPI003CF9BB8C
MLWGYLDPTVGKEQSGRRPLVVVSSEDYNSLVTGLLVVVPVTRVGRGWPNHVELVGSLGGLTGFAMTEQPRTVSRDRCGEVIGLVDVACLRMILRYLADFLGLD